MFWLRGEEYFSLELIRWILNLQGVIIKKDNHDFKFDS